MQPPYKILFVGIHRPNRSPSQRFRIEQFIPYLEQHGFQYDYAYIIREQDDKPFYSSGNYFKKLGILLRSIWTLFRISGKAKQYDLVFVQREAFMLGTTWFERRFAKRTKMLFDFDDSIWMQVISDGNKALGFLKNADKTKELISLSNIVFAGNNYLANYARQFNSNVQVIPTVIDTDKFHPKYRSDNKQICIGWSGSFSTLPHFEHAQDALFVLKQKYGDKIYFKVIGDGDYYNEKLQLKGTAWSSEREVEELAELDIGLMPLPDDEWTKGKCGFKGISYMALGITTVMSPVGVNPEIVKDGINGFLATDNADWVHKLSLLIEDEALRKRLGDAGRKTIVEHYSVRSQQQRYVDFFKQTIEGEKV